MGAKKIPSYRLHRPSGQAVCRLDGRDYYLGKHGTEESRSAYDRLVARWLAGGKHLPEQRIGLTVSGLATAYLAWAGTYYLKNGEETSEMSIARRALAFLRMLYGSTPAASFGALDLKAVRQAVIDAGCCRRTCNAYVSRIKYAFRWGVENELVPADVLARLRAVRQLAPGRSAAPDHPRVLPATREQVDGTLPFLPEPWASMVRLQELAGMRPGEVCRLTAAEIDRSREPWEYRPGRHKTQHHGKDRRIFLGPRARLLLAPLLLKHPEGPLFRNSIGTAASPNLYCKRVVWAAAAAGVGHWHPNQLRHNAATAARAMGGIEAAAQVIGDTLRITEAVYAEPDVGLARRVVEEIG